MDEEFRAKAATWDPFESEASFKVSPQLSKAHGCGMVPTKVVENGRAWNQSSFAEMLVWTSLSDCRFV